MENTRVRLTEHGPGYDCLECPDCSETNGVSYLHHEFVEVFNRPKEDADSSNCVITDGRESKLFVRDSADNPSLRRDGIRIAFFCELCPGLFWLNVVQHKGQTFLSWARREGKHPWHGNGEDPATDR